jgi:hypothetical protein
MTTKLEKLKAAVDAALAAYTAEVRRQEHQEKSHAH